MTRPLFCGTGAACSSNGCDDAGCSDCGLATTEHFPQTAGKCVTGCRGGVSGTVLPLLSNKLACGSGCGEIYWNEWACDPPECCDPCDASGCWVGPQTCCAPGFRVTNAIQCVGTGISRTIGSTLSLLGCGPCGLARTACSLCNEPNCGGCGVPAGTVIEDSGCTGCPDCANTNAQPASSGIHELEALTGEEFAETSTPAKTVAKASATKKVRQRHGRSPHRVFSRRIR